MARVITWVPNANYNDGVSNLVLPRGQASLTLTGNGGPRPGRVLITQAAEVEVALGLSAPGFVLIYNADTANYVRIGFSTGSYVLKWPAGFAAPLYLDPSQTSLFCIANTADCYVEFHGFDA